MPSTVNEIVMNTSKNTTCTYLLSNVPIQSWPRSRRNRSSRTVTIHNGVLPLDIPTFVAVACFARLNVKVMMTRIYIHTP